GFGFKTHGDGSRSHTSVPPARRQAEARSLLRILTGTIGERGESLHAPVKTGFPVAGFAVGLALHHEAQVPAVHLALDVAADDATRCAGLAAGRHFADAGQPQLAVTPTLLQGVARPALQARREDEEGARATASPRS